MRMYIDWFDTERISTGKISIVGATAPHTSSSRNGIKLVCMYSTVRTRVYTRVLVLVLTGLHVM